MAIEKQNGEIILFIKQKNYTMVNNNLGNGSFGKTVLLLDPYIDELFVAKKYEPEDFNMKEQFYKNFLDEIKILYKLNHNNIVRIYNYYAYDDICTGYILMEYIDGQDIGTFISNYFAPFAEVTLDDVFSQLIDAFCYIEEHGIIHRDIREANILISKTGTVKVIDFGIGKTFTNCTQNTDSLVSQINRESSDTLPQEFYTRTYSSLTDMFYLGELLNRLIDSAGGANETGFSYSEILSIMMEKKPESRYKSFLEIREAIGKHDFTNMNITDGDKRIYQKFANLIYCSINEYLKEVKFNTDPMIFISRLEKALKTNLFESVIQSNSDIISSLVLSRYAYDSRIDIPCTTVRDFLDWFKASTVQSQSLILNNLIAKISSIPVNDREEELPF